VAGSIDAGPVVTTLGSFVFRLASVSALMTKYLSVSIGRPLPGRRTLVVTRQVGWSHADVEVAHSVPEALTLAGPAPVVFVAGGGQVYAEAMPLATDLMITEVPLEPDGDITFPPIDPALWREASREDLADRSYVDYVRGADSQAS